MTKANERVETKMALLNIKERWTHPPSKRTMTSVDHIPKEGGYAYSPIRPRVNVTHWHVFEYCGAKGASSFCLIVVVCFGGGWVETRLLNQHEAKDASTN